ncbi:MAG: hypothetical protein K1W22_12215 [Lachnospiraceae bacterium]
MAMIWVDGVAIKTPSGFTWNLQDVSDSAAGRTQDALMHKNRIAQKRKLSFTWAAPTPQEAAAILAAFDPEYVSITYPDTKTGRNETKTFYTGDITSPMKIWTVGKKRYEMLSFDVIER